MMTDGSKEDAVKIRGWLIDGDFLRPSLSHLHNVCKWYSENVGLDAPITFVFHTSHDAENMLIHESRLELAGGPFSALAKGGFKEGKQKTVSLCEEDDPATFQVIKSFLYEAPIDVSDIDLAGFVKIAICSHRWGLTTLAYLVSRYISLQRMIKNLSDLLTARKIVELGDSEHDFATYFWTRTGCLFDELSPSLLEGPNGDIDEVSFPLLSTPRGKYPELFENVWDLAMSEGFIEVLFKSIIAHASQRTKQSLLYVIAAIIEPLLEDDSKLRRLLQYTVQEAESPTSILETERFLELGSSRMLKFTFVELARSSNLKKHAYDALSGMVSSAFWDVPLEENSYSERRVSFTLRNTFPSTGPDRLHSHIMISWNIKPPKFIVRLHVRTGDGFPNPFMAKLFLRTARCRCKSQNSLPKPLFSRMTYWEVGSEDREFVETYDIQTESWEHEFSKKGTRISEMCVVTLHVVVGHCPDRYRAFPA